jgi:uncharacterized membrane protein YeaQ/YmgE (transglycosylase-associated protein family)
MRLSRESPRSKPGSGLQERKGSIMGILSWIILGLIAGFIGSKIVNKTGAGMTMDIALGVVGAVVGGVLMTALGFSGVSGVNIYSIIVSIIGAVVVLYVYRMVSSRR